MTGITRAAAAQVIAGHFDISATHVGGIYDAFAVRDGDSRQWKVVSDSSIRRESRRGGSRNAAYDMLTTDEFNGEDILVDTVADTQGQAERGLLLDKLRHALNKLSEEERTLLEQYYFAGVSECELSVIHGISQQAVSKRVRKILAKLKKLIKI